MNRFGARAAAFSIILLVWGVHTFYEAAAGTELIIEDHFGLFVERPGVKVWLLRELIAIVERVIASVCHGHAHA